MREEVFQTAKWKNKKLIICADQGVGDPFPIYFGYGTDRLRGMGVNLERKKKEKFATDVSNFKGRV